MNKNTVLYGIEPVVLVYTYCTTSRLYCRLKGEDIFFRKLDVILIHLE
jgi:hypothetical protein